MSRHGNAPRRSYRGAGGGGSISGFENQGPAAADWFSQDQHRSPRRASGAAGLIKTILCLQHGRIPRHLHFDSPNPRIPWDQLAVKVVAQECPWPEESPRIAGVSSFGFTGTNAHLIVEAGPAVEGPAQGGAGLEHGGEMVHMLTLSAKTPEALTAVAAQYRTVLSATDEASAICSAAAGTRGRFKYRAAVVAQGTRCLREAIEALRTNAPTPAYSLER